MEPYRYKIAGPVQRAIGAGDVPLHIVDTLMALLDGDLCREPRRVGKPLDPPLQGKWSAHLGPDWRVIYAIDERQRRINVTAVKPRADVYHFSG